MLNELNLLILSIEKYKRTQKRSLEVEKFFKQCFKNKAKCKNKNINRSLKVSFFSRFKYNFLFLVNLIKLL